MQLRIALDLDIFYSHFCFVFSLNILFIDFLISMGAKYFSLLNLKGKMLCFESNEAKCKTHQRLRG